MKVMVLLRPVPDAAALSLHPGKGTLTIACEEAFLAEDDRAALELALRLKEFREDVEVIAAAYGDTGADVVLR